LLVSVLTAICAAYAGYGFDSYGEYFWADSGEVFAPAYSWIDTSGGTDLVFADEDTRTVQLPFDVMFYGRLFRTGSDFRISTDSDTGFGYAGMGICNGTDFSGPSDPDGVICLSWDVLYNPPADHLYASETTYGGENAWVISYVPGDSSLLAGEVRLQTIILETDGVHDSTIIHQFENIVPSCEHGDPADGAVVWYVDSGLLRPCAFSPARP
jgi:hypothetical protein